MDPRIDQAQRYIDNNMDKKVSLKSISKLSSLGYSYFSALFKKEVGICFSKYVKQKRMAQAKYLLESTSTEIKIISYSVGYKYLSNFHHDFKRLTGTTPLKFRENSHIANLANKIEKPNN